MPIQWLWLVLLGNGFSVRNESGRMKTHSCGLTVHSVGVVVVEVELQFLVCWVVGRVRYWVGDSQTGSRGALIKVWVEPSEFSTFVKTFHFSVFLKRLLCVVILFDFWLLSHLNNAPWSWFAFCLQLHHSEGVDPCQSWWLPGFSFLFRLAGYSQTTRPDP